MALEFRPVAEVLWPRHVAERGTRRRAVLPALVLLASSTAVVASLGAPLVPRIAETEHVSLASAQWVLTVTFLTGAVSAPLVGRVGSGRHRRPVILCGLALVVLGTVLAALPLGFGWMVFGRVLQGLGLSLTPLAIALARDLFDPPLRERAIATLSVTTVTGAGLGYPVASFIVNHQGVAAAYWTGALLSAGTLLVCAVVLPGEVDRDEAPIDLLSAVLLGGGAGGLLLVISQVHAWGWRSSATLLVAGAAALLLVTWVRWTLRQVQPLVDLRLAVRRGVLGANATALLAGASMYMLITLVVLLVQAPRSTGYGLGQSVTVAGLMLVPFSVTSVLGNRLTRVLRHRIRPDNLLPLGCVMFLVATLWMAAFRSSTWDLALAMAIGGLGSGCSFAAMPGLIVRFVPAAETGSAMSFNQILRYLGFSIGSALVLTVLELRADTSGALTRSGFTTACVAAALVALLAAAVALWLGRGVREES